MFPITEGRHHRLALLLALFFCLGSLPLQAQPALQHLPPEQAPAGQNLPVQVTITGAGGKVMMGKLYFRGEGETAYRAIDLVSQPPVWRGEIPGRFVTGAQLSYFISVLLDDQSMLTWPEINPYNNPFKLKIVQGAPPAPVKPATVETRPSTRPAPAKAPAVPPPSALPASPAQGDTLQLLSPDRDATLAADDVMIVISYFSTSSALNPASVRIVMDGREVTRQAEISDALISIDPPPLSPGPHTVAVKAADTGGRLLPLLRFRFFVEADEARAGSMPAAQGKKDFQAHAYADMLQESYGGGSEGVAMAGLDFSGQVSSFNYRGGLFLTSLESRHYQPRNRFSFSIGNRLAGASIGDSYPRLQELILAGRRVRGLTGYLHLGLVNVDLVYGELQRSVQTTFTTDDSGRSTPLRYGTFSQSILGVRPSLGDGEVFQLGVTMAKIRDDSSSIRMGYQPKDNLVLGPDIKLAILDGRLVFTGAAALSLLTRDISYGPATTEDIKQIFNDDTELPIDPADLADILIINDSTVPLDPGARSSIAWFLNAQFNQWGHAINIGYRSIGDEYLSLANPWLRKDLRGLYIQDRFRLYRNKLFLNLGYERYDDNFSRLDGNPSINLRTLNYGLSLFPGAPYPQLSVSMRDQLRDNHLRETSQESIAISTVLDTLITRDEREKSWFRDFVLQANQEFQLLDAAHQLSAGYISSRNIDEFKEERTGGFYSPDLSNRIVLLSLTSRYPFPLVTTLSYSGNHSEGASFQPVDFSTWGLTGEYRWLEERLSATAELRLVQVTRRLAGDDLETDRNQYRLGARWNISPGNSLMAEGQFWQYDNAGQDGGHDHDSLFRIRYDRYF